MNLLLPSHQLLLSGWVRTLLGPQGWESLACSHHTFTPTLIHSAHNTFVYTFFGGKCTHFSKISLCNGQREREKSKRKRGEIGPRDGWWSRSPHQGLDVEGRGNTTHLEHVFISLSSSEFLQSTSSPCPPVLSLGACFRRSMGIGFCLQGIRGLRPEKLSGPMWLWFVWAGSAN